MDEAIDDALSLLIKAYKDGCDYFGYLFAFDFVDIEKMNESVYFKIDGKDFADRLREYYNNNDFESFNRVILTEYHRNYNQGSLDTATRYQTETGEVIYKQWVTMMDERVRDTHDYLEGKRVPLDELFYTFDGDSALMPGGFYKPENNINCRCVLRFSKS